MTEALVSGKGAVDRILARLHAMPAARQGPHGPHDAGGPQGQGRPRRRPALFLDFDGTLAPIVEDPAAAAAPAGVLALLAGLATRVPVAIVSGRDIDDLAARIGVPRVHLAGNHGYAIRVADGRRYDHGAGFAPRIADVADALDAALASVEGVLIERKRASVAVHSRRVPDDRQGSVREAVERIAAVRPDLKLTTGKAVLELQPAEDWHKGAAVRWISAALGLAETCHVPVFIGDDVTDEDGFRAVADSGLGILVATEDRPTAATLRLQDPDAVFELLRHLDSAI